MNLKQTMICNFILFAVILVFAVILRLTVPDNFIYKIRYDDKCTGVSICRFNIVIKETVKSPTYLYIHFTDFFVNHRKVQKSVSMKQLAGQGDADVDRFCADMKTNADAGATFSFKNTKLDSKANMNPCGILASLFPRDNFQINKVNSSLAAGLVDSRYIETEGFNWDGYADKKYKAPSDG
jgi:LEM3 (ligand-effect modulator 3) family / CDC50 family